MDSDLANDNGKMLLGEKVLSYIYHVLSYVKTMSPNPQKKKTSFLMDFQPRSKLHLYAICPPPWRPLRTG